MSSTPARREVDVINPLFYIPEGVDELVYDETFSDDITLVDDDAGDESADETEYEYVGDTFVSDDDINYSDAPPTPDINGVVQEIVHTGPTGNQVIDVVIDVQDIDAAVNYEFRVVAL